MFDAWIEEKLQKKMTANFILNFQNNFKWLLELELKLIWRQKKNSSKEKGKLGLIYSSEN